MIDTEHLFNVTQQAAGHYIAALHPAIGVMGNPNGGYVLGLATKALYLHNPGQHLVSITCYFLAAPKSEHNIDIYIQALRQGRSVSYWSIDIYQAGKHCHRITASMSPDLGFSPENHMAIQAPEILPAEACEPITLPRFAKGLSESIRYLMEPALIQDIKNLPSDRQHLDAWMGFNDSADIKVWHILFFLDAMFPPIFLVKGIIGWVPTLELTVQLRNMPTSKLVQCHFKTQTLTHGILEEDGQMWDQNGNLIAISRQTAMFKPQPTD